MMDVYIDEDGIHLETDKNVKQALTDDEIRFRFNMHMVLYIVAILLSIVAITLVLVQA